MAISLTKIFKAGPDVSFNGSPTVSPTTAALWISDPFLTISPYWSLIAPLSIYFLALSHAPPVLAAEIAIWTPLTKAPGKNPDKMTGPKAKPRPNGVKMTKAPGAIISINEALVEILIQALWSGYYVPSRIPGLFLICLRTS